MPVPFKPTCPYPLPQNPSIVDRDGKPHVRIAEGGRTAFYPVTKDGKKYLKPAAKWYGEHKTADGAVKRVPLSANKEAAKLLLAELVKQAEQERAGIRDQYSAHRGRPVAELLDEYQWHSADRGNTGKQATQVVGRCRRAFEGCGFALLRDLDAAAVERWLADRRREPGRRFGVQTSNHFVAGLKAFGNWLVKNRRVAENLFRHLAKLNAEVDVRHVRRALSGEEFARLLAAAFAGKRYRKLSGPDREVLHLVAAHTGLRASELASLTPASFDLDAAPPTVTVEAAYSKHRRQDVCPVHPDLAARLRPWLATRPAGAPLWPGMWAANNEAGDIIKRDLETARAAWLTNSLAFAPGRRFFAISSACPSRRITRHCFRPFASSGGMAITARSRWTCRGSMCRAS
jgi:integrase